MAVKHPLAQYQRATIADYEKHRLFGTSWGEPGSRKTSFWLEGPAPVGVLSFDKGLEGVADRILREQPDKEIYVKEYDWVPSEETGVEDAQEVWSQYETDYKAFLQNCRTVLIDKENDLWQLCRYANGLTGGDEQRDFDKANLQYRRLINLAKATNVNVGFIRGCKDEWGSITKTNGQRGKGPTGNRVQAGFKELSGLVHLELHHFGLSPDSWRVEVGKVRGPGGFELAGQEFASLSFPEFAQLVFPDSDESEWV